MGFFDLEEQQFHLVQHTVGPFLTFVGRVRGNNLIYLLHPSSTQNCSEVKQAYRKEIWKLWQVVLSKQMPLLISGYPRTPASLWSEAAVSHSSAFWKHPQFTADIGNPEPSCPLPNSNTHAGALNVCFAQSICNLLGEN